MRCRCGGATGSYWYDFKTTRDFKPLDSFWRSVSDYGYEPRAACLRVRRSSRWAAPTWPAMYRHLHGMASSLLSGLLSSRGGKVNNSLDWHCGRNSRRGGRLTTSSRVAKTNSRKQMFRKGGASHPALCLRSNVDHGRSPIRHRYGSERLHWLLPGADPAPAGMDCSRPGPLQKRRRLTRPRPEVVG